MMNTNKVFKINLATYFLILTFLITGLIKNIILIYLIIIIHELGHIFIAKILKYAIIKVEIYPMGGVTTLNKPINTKIKDELLIAIFGVLFQIFLGLFFLFFLKLNFINETTYLLFKKYNLTIIIFNLLPLIPLDGYHILRSILEIFFSFHLSFYLSFIIGLASILIFIFTNGLFSLNNYLIITFLLFKLYEEYKNFKLIHFKFLLERFLNPFSYHKIKYNHKVNLNLLKKDTYHYFKNNKEIISETKLLKEKFDKT